jgi:hypothetical protein
MLDDAPESTIQLCTFLLKISKVNKNRGTFLRVLIVEDCFFLLAASEGLFYHEAQMYFWRRPFEEFWGCFEHLCCCSDCYFCCSLQYFVAFFAEEKGILIIHKHTCYP